MTQLHNTLINEWWTCEITEAGFTTLHVLNTYMCSNLANCTFITALCIECCTLVLSAYTSVYVPIVGAWIFLSCAKCYSFIFRMVPLTFSECKTRCPGKTKMQYCPLFLCWKESKRILYRYYHHWTKICLWVIYLRLFFSHLSFCHLSHIHMNKDEDLTKTALVCIKSS